LSDTENKIVKFDVDSIELITDDPTSQFAMAKVQAFSSSSNRHDMYCSEEVLQKTAYTIYNTPILYDVVKYQNDFGTHTEPGKSNIAGFIVPNSAEFIRLPDTRLSLQVLARVWKRYAPKVIEFFQRTKDNNRRVSVEMELVDSEKRPDGLLEMKDFIYTGVQLLGENVLEASPGACMQMLSFADTKKEFDEALRQEFSKSYESVDLSIPENIKKNASKGLELYKQHGKATSVSLAVARHIEKNTLVSVEKVRSMYGYLKSHKTVEKNKNEPDTAYINWMLYGGNEGMEWAQSIVEKLDEIDSKKVSYFGEREENKGLKDPKKEALSVEVEKEKELEKLSEESPEEEKDESKEEEKKEEEVETPEQEKKEDEVEQKDEKDKGTEKMSLDANLDVMAILKMLENETEDYMNLVHGHEAGTLDYSALCNAMYNKMCNMAEEVQKKDAESKTYMEECMSLRQFKQNVEAEKFMFEVEATLSDVSETMPKEEILKAREDAKNFSLETVDAWRNKVKSLAFSYIKGKKPTDGINRIGLPFTKPQPGNSSPWKR
jgi:hypothetical protein